METYISLLRGINMTGHNSIKMADLLVLYRYLGYNNAENYIQSGNVIFSSSTDISSEELSSKIEKAIRDRFSYNVPVMIRTLSELRDLKFSNLFLSEDNFDPSKMAVIFLHEKVTDAQINKVTGIEYPPDRFIILEREILIYCPNGFGRTRLYTTFFEKKMAVTGTARNWKTVTAILDIAEKR